MIKKILTALIFIMTFFNPALFGEVQLGDMQKAPIDATDPSKISLDFKGMDIIDVLKLLAQRGDMNISVSKNVRGKVTIFLKEVDIQDAFEIVLASNGLAYDIQGSIINVMTAKDYERLYGTKFLDKKEVRIFQLRFGKVSTISKALDQIKTKIGKVVTDESSNTLVIIDAPHAVLLAEKLIREIDLPTETRIFGLDYARAEDIKAKVEERLTENVGTVQVDERTNKLIVTDMSKKMEELERVISELDEKTSQVLIEAKIVQVTLNDDYKMGINWDYIFHEGYQVATGMNFRNISTATASILPAVSASADQTGTALTVGSLNSHDYQYVIELLESMGKTEILSAPRIAVINNEEASILVGSSRPYATTGTTVSETISETTQQVTYVDLGVKLHVTPTINRDGFITMKIKPEISSSTANIEVTSTTTPTGGDPITDTTSIPIIQTSTAETTVMVKNGNTIVLGGLIEERREETEDQVPILGDIPLIGNLFKRRQVGSGSAEIAEKTELVIFLTPYIVSGVNVAPETEHYLSTRDIGQSELKEDDSKQETSKIAIFGKKEKVKPIPKKRKRRRISSPKVASKKYYNTVRDRVYQKARENYPRSNIAGDVRVVFDLLPNGQLKGVPRVLGYADNTLGVLAIKSVYSAAPFPPFPSNLRKKQERFKILISYK